MPGNMGVTGYSGLPGAKGIQGEPGVPGYSPPPLGGGKGDRGNNGLPGFPGERGFAGKIGLPGLPVIINSNLKDLHFRFSAPYFWGKKMSQISLKIHQIWHMSFCMTILIREFCKIFLLKLSYKNHVSNLMYFQLKQCAEKRKC